MSTGTAIVLTLAALVATNTATWKLSRAWTLAARNRRSLRADRKALRVLHKVVRSQTRQIAKAAGAVLVLAVLAVALASTVS